ncbi:MAG: META domain-containing protein [Betaproteobacteria bacterium]|nr:META domain-containing protein [Betaproteobacteria bacterium]
MIRSALAVFLTVFMAACAHTQTMPITGEVWRPIWLEGWKSPAAATPEGSEKAYLRLMDGRVQGYGGCNWIAGNYLQTSNQVSFSRLISTRRACIVGMEWEDAFLKALGNVSAWERHGDLLRLYDTEKRLLIEMEAVKDQEQSLLPTIMGTYNLYQYNRIQPENKAQK